MRINDGGRVQATECGDGLLCSITATRAEGYRSDSKKKKSLRRDWRGKQRPNRQGLSKPINLNFYLKGNGVL